MNRIGCPEELQPQSVTGLGIVNGAEPIVFALIRPRTSTLDEPVHFPSSAWKEKTLSVCRGSFCSYDHFYEEVVSRQVAKPGSTFEGYVWALCDELRSELVITNDGSASNIGAVCVIDASLDHFKAHAHIGECKPSPDFWNRNSRTATKLNVVRLFEKRGISTGKGPPFPT